MTNLKLFIDEQIAYILALEHYAVVLFKLLFINFLLASSKIRVFFFFLLHSSKPYWHEAEAKERKAKYHKYYLSLTPSISSQEI